MGKLAPIILSASGVDIEVWLSGPWPEHQGCFIVGVRHGRRHRVRRYKTLFRASDAYGVQLFREGLK